MRTVTVGVLAHVDAGKTTITEQLLCHGGAIRRAGSVDQGTARTDFLPVERERGISVRTSTAVMEYNGVEINLIDTPATWILPRKWSAPWRLWIWRCW